MVKAVADEIDIPIRAQIKANNEASKRIAEHAGMRLEREENGTLYYATDPH